MPEENTVNNVTVTPDSPKNFSKIFILLIIIFGFITTFLSGYFLSHLLKSEQNATTKSNSTDITPTTSLISPFENPQIAQDSTKFLPGKYYFDDTILLVSKDKPQINIIATTTRIEQDKDYAQSTRVSFYDGTNWTRQSDSKTTPSSTIVSNKLIKNWNINIDPSRVLKQTVQGEITINNSIISFTTNTLQNEIGIRSLPGYTKFISNGTGTFTVNGATHQAYVLYTRIYSLNATEIQFYNQAFGVTTDWIAFWDTNGNFYHIDTTSVDKPTQIYQTHQLGVMEDVNGAVTKTFDVSVNRDSKNPPSAYTITLNNPINASLQFTRTNEVNKSPNGSFTWFMGSIEGTAKKSTGEEVNGIGVVEYIHN